MPRPLLITAPLLLMMPVVCTALPSNGVNTPREVTIRSHWGGLGNPQQTEIAIEKKNGKYYSGHKPISPDLIEQLVSALNAPATIEPDLTKLGITPQWLKDNAVSAALKSAPNFADAAQNQKDLFIKSFNDLEVLRIVVPGMFHFVKFDDYPSVSVVLTFDDGSSLSAESHAWYEFMLPWKMSRNGETTHNAGISRALASLMPKKATNRERLAGLGFDVALAESVMRYIEDDWKLLDTENKLGNALHEIRREYTVESAEINPYHHPEYGIEWGAKQPHETNLHSILRKADAPSNYVVALVLRIDNNKAEGIDQFLRSSQKYEAIPLSIPWLSDYIRQYPRVLFRVSYVHKCSFGEKALRVFSDDMHAIGKDNLIEEARAHQAEIRDIRPDRALTGKSQSFLRARRSER